MRYLKEDTIARFLEIPDILGASPVVFQMVSYLGAFPFLADAPAVLGLEQMVLVVTLMTERYRRVLARGDLDRRKLLFRSLAVYDRRMEEMEKERERERHDGVEVGARGQGESDGRDGHSGRSHVPGFAVDQAGDEEVDGMDEEDDELVLAAFESLDYVNVFRHGGQGAGTTRGAMIPADNFRKLIMLLLLTAPLGAQERLSQHSNRVVGDELDSLRSTAESILAAFLNVEKSPGIKYSHFNTIIPVSMPFLFTGFNALFEHFLFSKDLDFSKHKNGTAAPPTPSIKPEVLQPLLQDQGTIMSANLLSQLSFFLPGSSIFRRLRLLYSGEDDGFSMGSFETKVFNWRAPTILLVRGSRLPDLPHGGQETAFAATLPPRRFPHGSPDSTDGGPDADSDLLTFGAFLAAPWRHTHRECFGDAEGTAAPLLFQLRPVHDVFRASSLNKDYASFVRPSSATGSSAGQGGISFGCPPPGRAASVAHRRSSSGAGVVALGPVSLHLDAGFEFGVFTHDFSGRGGAFATSVSRRFDFQERFDVEAVEVWGCGGDEEAKGQAERWAWEAREAEARRRVNLGTGDIDADRALLEMAGLVGANRSGGSMG